MLRIHDILVWIRIRICGSMPLSNGSGSRYFCHWRSRCQRKTNFCKKIFCYYFLKEKLHNFSKIKSQKESQNSRNQVFSYYLCMMIEGSGSTPLTNGSGSGRPKNMWIRWIRIRIRICNTGFWYAFQGAFAWWPASVPLVFYSNFLALSVIKILPHFYA